MDLNGFHLKCMVSTQKKLKTLKSWEPFSEQFLKEYYEFMTELAWGLLKHNNRARTFPCPYFTSAASIRISLLKKKSFFDGVHSNKLAMEVELVSKELNHLAAILHVNAGV